MPRYALLKKIELVKSRVALKFKLLEERKSKQKERMEKLNDINTSIAVEMSKQDAKMSDL